MEKQENTGLATGALSHLSVELGAWRTMHDAPKNGTEILGWRADCGILLIKYMSASELFSEEELKDVDDDDTLFKDDWWATCWNGVWRLEGDEVPEFWMPLPAEPRSA